jgi:2-polyprenyl-6-methoxyphenol hydroxylase-like FAD-dependent oxidoreductase
MRIVCVGGGPAGLYFALLTKLRHPDHDVTVFERNPPGATYGWGVVFWDDLLDDLYRNDAVSAREVRRAAYLWQGQQVRVPGSGVAHMGGYGYSIGRAQLLDILAARAEALDVALRHEHEIRDPFSIDADLVVAADGVSSGTREQRRDDFGSTVREGRNRYIWLGTRKVFDTFTFAFAPTTAGWMWLHAYPSGCDVSTCIAECAPETWEALGFDRLTSEESTALLGEIFASSLGGEGLVDRSSGLAVPSRWLTFRQVTNATWRCANVVLVGDAAHTTHFAVGAGTKLAVHDAIELADQLDVPGADLDTATAAYDARRRADMRPRQAAAQESMEWFERLDIPARVDVVDFAYALWTRRGHYPGWRYRLHRATQYAGVRRLRRVVDHGRRLRRARSRERTPVSGRSPRA